MRYTSVILLSVLLSACQSGTHEPASIQNNISENTAPLSAKCYAQLAITESRSILAQSPTLSASINDEGDANMNLRLDIVDFHRAGLNRKLTLANCSHENAIKIARDVSMLSAGKLARNSHFAKAQKLNGAANSFEQQINAMKDTGIIEAAKVERLFKAVRNLRKQADRSIQRANGLEAINYKLIPSYEELEERLRLGLSEVQDQKTATEFYKNIRINVSGGIRYSEDDNNVSNREDEDEVESFGSVTLSVRLGMFDPRLKKQQLRLHQAEFEQLYEPTTGLLWQLQDLYQKNLNSEKSLLKERQLILQELDATRRALKFEKKPERALANRISISLLEADHLRININLKELQIILAKLNIELPQ